MRLWELVRLGDVQAATRVEIVVVVIQKVAPGVTAQACSVTYQSLSPVGTVYARLYTYVEI